VPLRKFALAITTLYNTIYFILMENNFAWRMIKQQINQMT